jgi:hypothetical protein
MPRRNPLPNPGDVDLVELQLQILAEARRVIRALDSGVPLPIEEIRDHDAEMAKEARGVSEKFMTGNGVARGRAAYRHDGSRASPP